MAGALKRTTGLTGMAVAHDPHKSLSILYNKILRVLARMPDEAHYKRNTQLVIQQRLQLVNAEQNVEKLEAKVNGGQVEELIKQAERELALARKMLEWQPWQPMIGEAPKNQWTWPAH